MTLMYDAGSASRKGVQIRGFAYFETYSFILARFAWFYIMMQSQPDVRVIGLQACASI